MRRLRSPALLAIAAVAAAGCLTVQDVLVGRNWALVEVHGAPPVAEASVSFGSDGRFVVRTGCNVAGGTFHVDGARILLDTVEQSLLLCEGDLKRQEAGILAVLKNEPAYAIDTRTGWLRLTSTADQVLVFEP